MTQIARCPEHGLHGARLDCFTCGGMVEQVDVILLPSLPPDAPADLRLKLELAVAAVAVKRGIGLQEAADWIGQTMGAVDKALEAQALSRPDPLLDSAPPSAAEQAARKLATRARSLLIQDGPQVRFTDAGARVAGPTVAGPSSDIIER